MGRTGPWYHPNCRKKPQGFFLAAFLPVNAGVRRHSSQQPCRKRTANETPGGGSGLLFSTKRLAPATVSLHGKEKSIFSARNSSLFGFIIFSSLSPVNPFSLWKPSVFCENSGLTKQGT